MCRAKRVSPTSVTNHGEMELAALLPLFRSALAKTRAKLMTAGHTHSTRRCLVIEDCCQHTPQRTPTSDTFRKHPLMTFQMLSRRIAAARPLSSAVRASAPRTTLTQLRFASENNANRENFVGELSVEDPGMVC